MSLTQVGPALISSIAGVSGGGKLLQTITTVKLDTFSTTSTSSASGALQITGLPFTNINEEKFETVHNSKHHLI